MPRLRFAEDRELDDEKRRLIAAAERTGAPDPRVVRIMVRSSAGLAWVRCWNSVLYEGRLPHKLKEMCRIRISVAHRCGYCSTVRSKVARDEGLTEALVEDLLNQRTLLSPREKAALEYADLFKSGDEAIDSDAVYEQLGRHFSEEEIVELGMLCAQTVGVGRFVRSLNILSWQEACALNPALSLSH
ncbi:MAG TPA: carboxymuconolactone decarboxylase family protein [Burkholderiales bacterium]|nr:carboxymuconolactone decarboxylase family protein [Burkholderiales bacterium]